MTQGPYGGANTHLKASELTVLEERMRIKVRDLGGHLGNFPRDFEDQPGEIGNFARRFWRIARKVDNFTRGIWKSRRSSTERVDT